MAAFRNLSLTVITGVVFTFAACGNENNTKKAGEACEKSSECASDLCVDGVCAGTGGNTTTTTNTTTNSGGTGGAGTGGSGTGAGPVQCTVEYTTADTTPCDPLNPAAACGPTEFCNYTDDMGTLGCVPQNSGVKALGENCGSDAECSGASQCIAGKCSAFCCPGNNQPCASQSGLCDLQLGVTGNNTVYTYSCSFRPACALLMNECAMGTYCHPADQAQAISVCDDPTAGGPKAEGEACMYRNDCGESSICADDMMGGGVCRQLCKISDWMNLTPPTGGCPPDTAQVTYSCEGVNWGQNQWADIGVCIPTMN